MSRFLHLYANELCYKCWLLSMRILYPLGFIVSPRMSLSYFLSERTRLREHERNRKRTDRGGS